MILKQFVRKRNIKEFSYKKNEGYSISSEKYNMVESFRNKT